MYSTDQHNIAAEEEIRIPGDNDLKPPEDSRRHKDEIHIPYEHTHLFIYSRYVGRLRVAVATYSAWMLLGFRLVNQWLACLKMPV